MKVFILIPVYKRPEVFTIVYKRLNEIRLKSKLDITVVLAGDNSDPCKVVYEQNKQGNDEYIICNNLPVSNKFNYLYDYIKDEDFDYSIITGSDDLISDKGFKELEDAIFEQEYHYICFSDINFYDSKTKKAGYFIAKNSSLNKSIGCYRALHKDLLKAMKFKPYFDGSNSGIDYTMEQNLSLIKGINKKQIVLGNTGDMVDVKSNVNINSFQYLEKIFNLADVNKFPN